MTERAMPLHRFRGPNEPYSELGVFSLVSMFIRLILKPKLNRKKFAWLYDILLSDPGGIAIAIAANDLLTALSAFESERAKLTALAHLETDQRHGRPVWGNPVGSNVFGALQECQAALMQFYIQVAAILERSAAEAKAEDEVTKELHAGRAMYLPDRPGVIVRKTSPPNAPPE